ncbi:hypothetical protein [Carboxylicivirga sp. N1Y90]|uniref:hypothetical protein n=1 Tax=Carboxylicivirga fragile TaxID=3417571 RepID=UPI003D350895|nr:hypothetical protein [Marinilabiliaceae bacterium N1Y90]
MTERYDLTKKCNKCGNIVTISLTKIQAAFDTYDTNKFCEENCDNCGVNHWKEISITTPKFDIELLDIWGNTLDFQFWEQDEDLMFSSFGEIDIILSAVNKDEYLPEKMGILINTLFVILYDAKQNNFVDLEHKVFKYLQENHHMINKYQNHVDDYLKEKVLPIINY